MVRLLAADLNTDQAYRLLSGVVVPRPIAWVSTLSANGQVNLAPFSAFTFVSTEPPMVGISVTSREGRIKDTQHNIERRCEFTVNIATAAMAAQLHASSAAAPSDVSEADLLGLGTSPGELIDTPRLTDTPVSLECRLSSTHSFGRWHRFIVGEVVVFHVHDALLSQGKIDTRALDPLARIAGPHYTSLGAIVSFGAAQLPSSQEQLTGKE